MVQVELNCFLPTDLPTQVPPLTPGTNQKMSQALAASFNSWEKERELCNIPKGKRVTVRSTDLLQNSQPTNWCVCVCSLLSDPQQWSEADVSRWLDWAIKEFNLEGVDIRNFSMQGKEMCALGKELFLARAPQFVGDILFEHLERLLSKGEFLAL